MSVDATKLVIPGHGTVFHAPRNTRPPVNPLQAFTLMNQPAGWINLGHTSKANTIAFTKEGGDRETLGTFLADAVRTTTASTSWGCTIPALQFDPTNLRLAFNGEFAANGGYTVASPAPVDGALFLLFQDVSGALGFWIPDTSTTLGEAPSVDTANFLELPLSAAFQSADADVLAPVNGRAALFQIFKTGLLNTGYTVTPTGGATGGEFTLLVNGASTAPIAHDAAAAAVKSAIDAIGAPTATVTGSGPYAVSFASPGAALSLGANLLTGGTSANVSVSVTP